MIIGMLCFMGALSAFAEERPNIIFVITDDMSWGEIARTGNKIIRTPNLDCLYDQSLRFRNFHVASYCAPTRAQLMSGRQEFFAGVTDTRYERDNLRDDITILPQYFKQAGYRTAMVGKWHLASKELGLTGKPLSPHKRGFDMALYTRNQLGRYNPWLSRNGKQEEFQGYCGDIIFDETMKWIENGDEEQPYFVYLATSIPHGPLVAPEEFRKMYEGSGLTEKEITYYAMVSNVDTNMGRLMKWLEKRQDKRKTILIFMTDNGHSCTKGFDGAGHNRDGFLRPDGLYNAGLRGGKGQQWHGGTCVPFLLYWPGIADQGRDDTTLTGGIDILPTFCDIAGVKPDDMGIQGVSLLPNILEESTHVPENRIIFSHGGRWNYPTEMGKYKYNVAVITDRYRLVWEPDGKKGQNMVAKENSALYDYRSDPGEKQNIIDLHPELVQGLTAAYEAWWEEAKKGMVNDWHQIKTGKLIGPEKEKK